MRIPPIRNDQYDNASDELRFEYLVGCGNWKPVVITLKNMTAEQAMDFLRDHWELIARLAAAIPASADGVTRLGTFE